MKEAKAIDRCKQLIKEEHANWIGISNQVAIETVLNIIQTQQKEIEKLKCNNQILQGELDRIGVEALKLEAGSSADDVIAEIEKKEQLYHRALSDLVKSDRENIKKDRIIDLMAGYMATHKCWIYDFEQAFSKDIKEHFARNVEQHHE